MLVPSKPNLEAYSLLYPDTNTPRITRGVQEANDVQSVCGTPSVEAQPPSSPASPGPMRKIAQLLLQISLAVSADSAVV